jgi:hypothetical protein
VPDNDPQHHGEGKLTCKCDPRRSPTALLKATLEGVVEAAKGFAAGHGATIGAVSRPSRQCFPCLAEPVFFDVAEGVASGCGTERPSLGVGYRKQDEERDRPKEEGGYHPTPLSPALTLSQPTRAAKQQEPDE